jgi:hypothetical protein
MVERQGQRAFALHEVRRSGQFEVVGALTTVTETFGRVSIHGVRQEILQAQCEAAGLPPHIVPISYPCPNEIYEARMGEADFLAPPSRCSGRARRTRRLCLLRSGD